MRTISDMFSDIRIIMDTLINLLLSTSTLIIKNAAKQKKLFLMERGAIEKRIRARKFLAARILRNKRQ